MACVAGMSDVETRSKTIVGSMGANKEHRLKEGNRVRVGLEMNGKLKERGQGL